jgi:hypothetical protein
MSTAFAAPTKTAQLILLEKYQKHAPVTASFTTRTAAARKAGSTARPARPVVDGASVTGIEVGPSSYSRSSMGSELP